MNPISLQGRYTTTSGAPVRILCVDSDGMQPVVGIQDGDVWTWGIDGQFNVNGRKSAMDLIEVTAPPDSPLLAAARKVVECWDSERSAAEFEGLIKQLEGAINGQ